MFLFSPQHSSNHIEADSIYKVDSISAIYFYGAHCSDSLIGTRGRLLYDMGYQKMLDVHIIDFCYKMPANCCFLVFRVAICIMICTVNNFGYPIKHVN